VNRLYLLATIACFVLVVAAINYVILTTARAISRAKEVAVRKVSGTQQFHLVYQFLGDSVMVTLLAMLIALAATWAIFPLFRDFIGKPINTTAFGSPVFIFGVTSLGILVGIIAGAYPALALSAFRPASVLKGSSSRSGEGTTLRNVLTVLRKQNTFATSSAGLIKIGAISKDPVLTNRPCLPKRTEGRSATPL